MSTIQPYIPPRLTPQDYVYVPNSALTTDLTYIMSVAAHKLSNNDYEHLKRTLSSLLTSGVFSNSLPLLNIVQAPIVYDMKGKPKRPKKILVGVELNPGPKKNNPLALIRAASSVSSIVSLVKKVIDTTKQPPKKKLKSSKANTQLVPYKGGVVLGNNNSNRFTAPVSSISSFGGSKVKMSNIPGVADGMRLQVSAFVADIGIAASGSITSVINFFNYFWSTGYYGTANGNWSMPWDPNNMTAILSNIGGCYQKFRIVGAKLRYHGGCATSTVGQIGLFTTTDPAAATTFGNNPSSSSSILNSIRTSPACKMFPVWSEHVEQSVTHLLDNDWKYVFDTSANQTDDLRLSVCGNTTVVGLGVPTQTNTVQFFGTLEMDLIVDFRDMINPTIT
jgi:hypothetical protein